MVATHQELTDMETYFAQREIPKTFKINKATTYQDLPRFINNAFKTLAADGVSELAKKVRWEDLCQIKNVMENGYTE
jgi:hypothetical protein